MICVSGYTNSVFYLIYKVHVCFVDFACKAFNQKEFGFGVGRQKRVIKNLNFKFSALLLDNKSKFTCIIKIVSEIRMNCLSNNSTATFYI